MKIKKYILAISTIVFAFVGCNSPNQKTTEDIKIGLLSVFSGEGANYGVAAKTGVDLAVEEINNNGGLNGRKIEIIYEDDKGTTKDAVSGFQKLSTIDKVPAVIGPFYSGQVLACAPEANKTKTVLITGSGTSDNIRTSGEFVFRTCPTNEEQGRTIAQFCINDLKKAKAFIIYRNADYGVTLKERFKEEYVKSGGIIVGEAAIEQDANDAKSQLILAQKSNPDVVFIPVHYPEGGVILKQAKELGIKTVFIGGDGGFDPQLVNIAGNAAEGSYWATIGWGGNDIKKTTDAFIKNYQIKYKKEPGVYSGLYYDAVKVIVDAMNQIEGEINGNSVASALLHIKNYTGPSGVINFTQEGEVEKPFSIYKIENNKFNLIK